MVQRHENLHRFLKHLAKSTILASFEMKKKVKEIHVQGIQMCFFCFVFFGQNSQIWEKAKKYSN